MEQRIKTRFTDRFGIPHPVALAPMDKVSGGKLAAAVTNAGGLGLLGGGYPDAEWLDAAFADAGNADVGVGFITWALHEAPEVLAQALQRKPKAVMVSFGDAEPFVEQARAAGVPALWQVQTLRQAEQALAAGAEVIVAQGQEAGGHGGGRGLATLVPAVRDLAGPEQIILAAGGVTDGRGLAAALMMGADGVLVGTRFYASEEAVASQAALAGLLAAGGDDTVRSNVFDVARGLPWPRTYTGRVVENDFLRDWIGDLSALEAVASQEQARYGSAALDDFSIRALIAGEGVDGVTSVEPAGNILTRLVDEAAGLLAAGPRWLAS